MNNTKNMSYAFWFETRCDSCGKKKTTTVEKYKNSWKITGINETCECGGKYILYYLGAPVITES